MTACLLVKGSGSTRRIYSFSGSFGSILLLYELGVTDPFHVILSCGHDLP